MKKTALALLSGGLDSTAALLLATANVDVKLAVTFDYGQKSAQAEIRAAQNLCAELKLEHKILELTFLAQHEHPLFSAKHNCPTPEANHLDEFTLAQKTANAVWVPNRNGVFINCAASLAEARQIQHIVVGFNVEEAKTFPDNSESYIKSINQSLRFSTRNQVTVISPTSHLNKTQIVANLVASRFDFGKLWSCYQGHAQMCGQCESCQRLKRALSANKQTHWIAKLFVVD